MKDYIKNNINHIISITIILVVGLAYIRENTSIRIVGDEFGYWAAGSWFAGKDWSEVASNNAYYSYGYGLLLALIMKVTTNAIIQYRLAIILNIVMLTCVYIIICCMVNRLELWETKYLSSSVALVLTMYTGNIFHAQFTMTETLLLLGYWGTLLLICSIYKDSNIYKIFCYILLLAYLFAVHQRMIGVFIAGIFVLLCIQIRDEKWKHIVFSMSLACVFLLLTVFIKRIYQDTYLSVISNDVLVVNDFPNQIKKIKQLFTIEGIFRLFIGVIGKFFYIFSSGYLLSLLGMYEIVKDIIVAIKAKKFSCKEVIYVYGLLTTIMLVGISSVFFFVAQERFDFLIYGRYSEFVMSFLVLLGLFSLVQQASGNYKIHLIIILVYLFLGIIVQNTIPVDAVADNSHVTCSGINDVLKIASNNIYAVCGKTIVVYIMMVVVLKLIFRKNMNMAVLSVCVILGVNWLISFCYTYEKGTLSWAVEGCSNREKQAQYIKELDVQDNLYYYIPDKKFGIDYLQFLLGDATIHCFYSEDQLANLPENAYILTDYSTTLNLSEMQKSYTQISNAPYQLWRPKKEWEIVDEVNDMQNNRFKIGLEIFLEDYPDNDSKPIQLLSKWNNWQDEMSYLLLMDGKNFAIIFSETGTNTEGLWLDISILQIGRWQEVLITFENGLVNLYVNGELKGSRCVTFDSIYNTDLVPTVGSNLEGVIRDVYVAPINVSVQGGK